ncbi:MAG: cupin domain-containing protein [Verrucomicrobiae bacterium]|nr:cupin domain-containing protein [Verrucomicrobiae bacterium]
MTQESHLGGGVIRHRLPVRPPETGADATEPRRLALPSGELAQLTDGRTAFRHIACLELREGTLRGNHRHEQKQEWFYLVAGRVTFFAVDPDSGQRMELKVEPGDLLEVAPGVAHALRVEAPGLAVEFAPQPFDPADTRPHPVFIR